MNHRARRTRPPIQAFYDALSRMSHAIALHRDPQALYDELCAICVGEGFAKIAYVVVVDGSGHGRPVAASGPADALLDDVVIPLVGNPDAGLEPVASALQRREPYVANDLAAGPALPPWRARAIAAGSRSIASFPIRRSEQVAGALCLHAARTGFFDEQTVGLIERMVTSLSFALDSIDLDTGRTTAMREVERAHDRWRKVFASSPIAMAIFRERDLELIDANGALCALLGVAPDERASDAFRAEALRCRDSLDLAAVARRLRMNHRVSQYEGRIHSRSGHVRDVSLTAELIDLDGTSCLLAQLVDETERKAYEACLERFTTHDGVTGLPNRHHFYERAERLFRECRRTNTIAAIVVADVDRMKAINDELGHRTGDNVLRLAGERLGELVDGDDPIARLAGDEFVMLFSGLRVPPDVRPKLAQVCESLSSPLRAFGSELRITASLGVAFYPRDGLTIDALVGKASTAMIRAKEFGSGSIEYYAENMSAGLRPRLELEVQLQRALAKEELFVEYQPQVRLADGRIDGVEALLRWRHPSLGIVPPATFIPVAEESGTIVAIGDWVLREACAQAVAWQRGASPAVTIAVNVSARQLLLPDFEARVIDALQATGLPPERLELEITESVIARDVDRAAAAIRELRRIGVRFAIDDFGTGYSSLSYLKHFRVDRIKIDQSFVRGSACSEGDCAIVHAIISLAKHIDLLVTAEGVETVEQSACLAGLGCDAGQGYLFSRPRPAVEIGAMLVAGRDLRPPPLPRATEASTIAKPGA